MVAFWHQYFYFILGCLPLLMSLLFYYLALRSDRKRDPQNSVGRFDIVTLYTHHSILVTLAGACFVGSLPLFLNGLTELRDAYNANEFEEEQIPSVDPRISPNAVLGAVSETEREGYRHKRVSWRLVVASVNSTSIPKYYLLSTLNGEENGRAAIMAVFDKKNTEFVSQTVGSEVIVEGTIDQIDPDLLVKVTLKHCAYGTDDQMPTE